MRPPNNRALMCAALIGGVLVQPSPGPAAPKAWPNPGPKKATSSGHPEVLFTFDDGPHERYTEKILATLAAHDVKAIFYWSGYRVEGRSKHKPTRRGLVATVLGANHLIGNHTLSHSHLCKLSAEKAAVEIDRNREIFDELAMMPTFLFRAPYGDRCPELEGLLAERKLRNFHWDIDAREWKHKSAAATAAHVIGELRHLEGRAAVLMHDTTNVTVVALPKILDWIARENKRRQRKGRPTIHIISGSDLVERTFDLPLWEFAQSTLAQGSARLAEATRRLLPGNAAPRSARR